MPMPADLRRTGRSAVRIALTLLAFAAGTSTAGPPSTEISGVVAVESRWFSA